MATNLKHTWQTLLVTAAALPLLHCGGPSMSSYKLTDQSSTQGPVIPTVSSDALYKNEAFGKAQLRRLTRYELTNTLTDAVGVNPTNMLAPLPEDLRATTYFDNEAGTQPVSSAVIEGYRAFAESYSASVANNVARVNSLAGCTPANVSDRNCFIQFAQRVGRRLLRREFSTTEANHYADILLPYAVVDSRFGSAIALLLKAWLQHPEFLYRFESGVTTGGLQELNDYQIATRMSYLIWGSSPDDTLLNAARAGQLHSDFERVSQAQRMLIDARAKRHIDRFHSEWLGYGSIQLNAALEQDMRTESDKLVERVVFETNRDWMELFNWNETYVSPALAANYGMAPVASPQWVNYVGKRGGGILSHGSFAALGSKFGDTSPTLRGYEVFKRLMCGKLGSIPAGVDTDNPPGLPGQCKTASYNMRTLASCKGCHSITDNIGFGLENLGVSGQWREVEAGNSQCTITGDGTINQVAYSGPKALGDLISKNPSVAACATRQLFRFMSGRLESSADEATLNALNAQYLETRTLNSLVLALVKTPAIMYKGAQ